ncbi:conjugal transfer protein [Mycobacteroides abscessus]|uniref:conjugal transfer protein n=1 Tax=Mycobacteroides abscessus TaxID=36809 RepID=UPI00092835BB|nr:conjugal transfer protein [Mycobacteroides abscessus]SHY27198.1 Conjugative transposon protein TcpC [Mycobacteroides abscessus subsp. abscessus]SID73102.1 Conjugative transposon protein TcpC [Mycobacteroides abscessus subsp. abscessus]SIK17876.1 Conjugative transposon protein TcpC [Mycobacteroides abscessus subsp. abscessus]SIM42081.1 Conjugative transposon protein TcpC [Mycobacteroides abscessus subsp. abscessus]SKM13782.1 Conjugative transposon protein TcpC [Mycobacteroides abscessus subs
MNFRPSPTARARSWWSDHKPDRRTLSRAAVLASLGLGVLGGLNTVASSCAPHDTVTTDQLNDTVNRATAVKGFADAFINVFLAGKSAGTLTAFTDAPITASAIPVTVIKTAPWSAKPQPSGYANVNYWSVVIGAFVKPISAAPELRFYQVPVAVVEGTLRVTAAPAFVNGPDLGYDIELDYPAEVSNNTDLYNTAADFLNTWLVGTAAHPASGDINRYSIADHIQPFDRAPFTGITIDAINAQKDIPANAQNGYSTKILVTAEGAADDKTNQTITYPLTVIRQSDKWFISDIDLAPQLAGRITKPTETAQPSTTTTQPSHPN